VVAIWWRSETFAHGFVVAPISLWLVWRRRDALARVAAKPWWPGVIVVLAMGALWLVTSVAGVLGVRQFALLFMVQAAIVAVIGLRVARELALPLAFLLFAVPAGEFLVPTLMDWTAEFVAVALRVSGVPAYREANHFVLPTGRWSVVEACSGIRYVIASFMVGTIYAAISYTSMRRRAYFIAASIVVPVVANWLRAYIIVMIGHLSDNRLAAGVDHLIYGWVFFGVVMVLLFWVGSFWQQSAAPVSAADEAAARRLAPGEGAQATGGVLFAAALACIAAAGVWLPVEARIDRPTVAAAPSVPIVSGAGGWTPTVEPPAQWKPRYRGFGAESMQGFRSDGRDVGLYIAYYRSQEKGRELVTSGNTLVSPDDWYWRRMAVGSDRVEWAGSPVAVATADVKGERARLEVFRLFWVDGSITASEYVAKARLAWSKLMGRGDDSALVVMFAPVTGAPEDARATLRTFAASMSPSIERALAGVRGR
jgi:exosortase A